MSGNPMPFKNIFFPFGSPFTNQFAGLGNQQSALTSDGKQRNTAHNKNSSGTSSEEAP
jgi:hypothetical protein